MYAKNGSNRLILKVSSKTTVRVHQVYDNMNDISVLLFLSKNDYSAYYYFFSLKPR